MHCGDMFYHKSYRQPNLAYGAYFLGLRGEPGTAPPFGGVTGPFGGVIGALGKLLDLAVGTIEPFPSALAAKG